MKKLLLLCCLTLPLAAETLVKPGGQWVPVRDTATDRNRNGQIDRNEWSRPLPSKKDRPWAQPQPLRGQTTRWDLKWVENPAPTVVQATKI